MDQELKEGALFKESFGGPQFCNYRSVWNRKNSLTEIMHTYCAKILYFSLMIQSQEKSFLVTAVTKSANYKNLGKLFANLVRYAHKRNFLVVKF